MSVRPIAILVFLWVAGVLAAEAVDVPEALSSDQQAAQWYQLGTADVQGERWKAAEADFLEVLNLRKDDPDTLNMLGFVSRHLGRIKQAYTFYDRALALRPNFPEAREYYGEASLQDGDLAGAIRQYVILHRAGAEQADELLEKISDAVSKVPKR